MESELIRIKLLDKKDVKNQDPKNPLFRKYFMHGTSHHLGLDVHDAGSTEVNNQPRKLLPGMVTTIEPGIYIRPNKPVIEFPLLERDPIKIRDRRK